MSEVFGGLGLCVDRPRLCDDIPLIEPLDEHESVEPLLDVPKLLVVERCRRLRRVLSSLENVPLRLPFFG